MLLAELADRIGLTAGLGEATDGLRERRADMTRAGQSSATRQVVCLPEAGSWLYVLPLTRQTQPAQAAG